MKKWCLHQSRNWVCVCVCWFLQKFETPIPKRPWICSRCWETRRLPHYQLPNFETALSLSHVAPNPTRASKLFSWIQELAKNFQKDINTTTWLQSKCDEMKPQESYNWERIKERNCGAQSPFTRDRFSDTVREEVRSFKRVKQENGALLPSLIWVSLISLHFTVRYRIWKLKKQSKVKPRFPSSFCFHFFPRFPVLCPCSWLKINTNKGRTGSLISWVVFFFLIFNIVYLKNKNDGNRRVLHNRVVACEGCEGRWLLGDSYFTNGVAVNVLLHHI